MIELRHEMECQTYPEFRTQPKTPALPLRSMGQEFPANVIAGIIIRDKPWDQSLECRPNWEGK